MGEYSPVLHLLYKGLLFYEGILGKKIDGAQVIVRKGNDILLVHTRYRPYWEFPGGKAERYEAPEVAAVRETKEEARVFVKHIARKLGTYTHAYLRRHTTIHVYVADEWEELDLWVPNIEIGDRKFFPLDALPEHTSPATQKRIGELLSTSSHEFSGAWE
jgi:8-oxo-dGTP pyrophosphatase MutT (NUDIX family)